MARIAIKVPGEDKVVWAELAADEVLLVGRHPDEARLAPGIVPAGRRVRSLTIAGAPTVSSNHALLWLEGGRVVIVDASKNGSWVRVPREERITLAADGDLSVQLGAAATAHAADKAPPDPTWAAPRDFAPSLVASVTSWLQEMHVDALVTQVTPPTRPPPHGARLDLPFEVPLADGSALQVVPRGTADERWTDTFGAVWRYVERQNARYRTEEDAAREGLILASPAIREVHAQVVEAARAGQRLLLLGPSGSGKEGMARCYHRHSGRADAQFVARSCGEMRPDLLSSELFGAEPGAYTGATNRTRIGAVERAHGGTLFLDEVGDASLEVQQMLLRFLDQGEFHRLGSTVTRYADVRVVCATNSDLRGAMDKGTFRRDLWFRISVAVVEVPPLRQRPADVVAFLRGHRLVGGTSAYAALAPAALPLVLGHAWDGNFRELRNFVARLPPRAEPESVGVEACRRMLAVGSPTTPPGGHARMPPPVTGARGWPGLMEAALAAFVEDAEAGRAPGTWDDVKEFVEKYLKPLLFVDLAGIGETITRGDVDIQDVADKLDADRGTALKQLNRYFERFRAKK